MTMTRIESDQWSCRARTWFRFRWRPRGKLRGFPWWAKHRWRGVKATQEPGLGAMHYLTMACTRCGLGEEIHITNLAEFLFCADVKLPSHVREQLGLVPPDYRVPLWKRVLGAVAYKSHRFVKRSKWWIGRLARLALVLGASPVLVPVQLYKDWHHRRLRYLERLGELKHGDRGLWEEARKNRVAINTHTERFGELEGRLNDLEQRPTSEVSLCQVRGCDTPEICGICHRCAQCSPGVPLDVFTGLHNHNIQTEPRDGTFGQGSF